MTFRNLETPDNSLVMFRGRITLSGSGGTVNISHNLSGTIPTVTSGSAPGIFTGSAGVQRLTTGKYRITFKDSYPSHKDTQFTPFLYQPLFDVRVVGDAQTTTETPGTTDSGTPCGGHVDFWVLSGSSGVAVPYDPTGSIQIHVDSCWKKSVV